MTKTKRLLLSKEDSWVRPYFKKYRKLLALVLLLGILTFFSASALMFTSGFLISRSAAIGVFNATNPPRPENIMKVYVAIVLTRAFGIGRPTFRYIERLGSHNWVLKMTSDIRLKLYRSLESRAAKSKEDFQSGKIMGILAEDIEHIQNLYLRTIFPTLIGFFLYLLVVIGLGYFSFSMGLFAFVMFGIITIIIPFISITINQARLYRRKFKRHELYTQLTDSILGVGDWQYSGRHETFLTAYNDAEAAVRTEDAALNKHARARNLLIQAIFSCIVVGLFIWAGSYFQSAQALNWIAAFVLAAFPLIDAFAPISDGVAELPLYEDSAQRLHTLPQPDNILEVQHLPEQDLPKHGNISFKDVSFHYPESQKQVLNQLNLEIQPGEVVAILGRSGTGKTTLAKLLRGDLLATSGKIIVDGVNVSNLSNDMSHVMGVLNQTPHLFDTTILNNIKIGNQSASNEAVERAAIQAGLGPVLAKLPKGIHTHVEESGKRFSGGERQRIALARLLVQNTPIVIIDEPTIGLDPITERELLTTVFDVLKDRTIVWITHHLVAINHAERVVFMADGQITIDGTPDTLKKNNAHYQHLLSLDYV